MIGKPGDSVHEIIHVDLKGGAVLHRFLNRAGVPYSAIYLQNVECWSNVREDEGNMLKLWNEQYEDDWKEEYGRRRA